MSRSGEKVASMLLSVYMLSATVAAAYYNWEYARTNGFLRWALFGEIVPTARALVWPYFVLHPSRNLDTDIERTRLTSRQISESEIKKFILAINYSQQAAYLLNTAPHENLDDYPNLRE